MKKIRMHMALSVEDIHDRSNPEKCQKLAGYDWTEDEIKQVLKIIRDCKTRVGAPLDKVGTF